MSISIGREIRHVNDNVYIQTAFIVWLIKIIDYDWARSDKSFVMFLYVSEATINKRISSIFYTEQEQKTNFEKINII